MHRALCSCVVMFLALAAVAADRAPVPAPEAQDAAVKQIKDIFKAEYADTTAGGRAALIEKLLKQAKESDDPSLRYPLLAQARDLAAGIGDARQALATAKRMDDAYAGKPAEAVLGALATLRKLALPPAAAGDAAYAALAAMETALQAEDMDAAAKLATAADSVAARVADAELAAAVRQRTSDVRSAVTEAGRVAGDRKVLADKPDDPRASSAVGRFLCFTLGRWDDGLKFLANSAEPKLQEAAALDRANPADARAMLRVADAWAALAGTARGLAKARLTERALTYYRKAIPTSTGLDKLRAAKYVAAAEANIKPWESTPYTNTVDAKGIELGYANRGTGRSLLLEFETKTSVKTEACFLTKRKQLNDFSVSVWMQAPGNVALLPEGPFYMVELKSKTLINDGNWHTVRVEKAGASAKLWVDQVYEGTIECRADLPSTGPWMTGFHFPWGRGAYDGQIRHVRIESSK